jgi:rare lipoprotein A
LRFLAVLAVLAATTCSAQVPGYARGQASWYGQRWQGRKMANGHRFNPHALTAASYDFPLGTVLEVSLDDKRVTVVVTDRGPARRLGRLVDLSDRASRVVNLQPRGVAPVAIFVRRYTP